ncbi:MAG: glycosyltransferase family 4 protein [Burkholderiales bacterium]|nr:glycosyltransferase family 4 protein [Burkholderiales bacterium]
MEIKKILIIGSNSIHCRRYIVGIINNSNFKVEVITNHQIDEINVSQHIVNFSLRNLGASKLILSVIDKFNPDVVHIHQANSYAWHTFRALKKSLCKPKRILTTWGSDVLLLPKQNPLMKKMVVSNLLNADIITSDSLYMSSIVEELIHPYSKIIKTINFGIQSLPNKQNLNNKEKIILSNRLHKSLYRVDKIIKAFALLCRHQEFNDYKLVVAANGEETNSLKALVSDLKISERVKFTGMLSYDELVEYYRKARIFVSFPKSDGTASSLLESMAYGAIPVLSNLPANLEWVIDECNGFIASDVENLFDKIIQAIKLSQDRDLYLQIYDFNYSLIKTKAIFTHNIQKFTALY